MRPRHVVEHFFQVNRERRLRVPDSQTRIQARNDGTLRTCLTTELLWLAGILANTPVNHAVRQCRVTLPPVNVGTNPAVINIRVASFRHPRENGVHPVENLSQMLELRYGVIAIATCRRG